MNRFALFAAICLASVGAPVQARENLGLYGAWGTFRDPLVPRCYAIAMAEPSARQRDYQPYASIGTWPRRGQRGQVHFRLSRKTAQGAAIAVKLGRQRIVLVGGGGDAWPRSDADNAAIVAAMRANPAMTVYSRDGKGRPFGDTYALRGAASAMDAALIGCARLR